MSVHRNLPLTIEEKVRIDPSLKLSKLHH